ncbi:MAG: hypothetical protein HYS18_00850 [Burkholderiales bacterium]|nr:hypothetical protein [Burkholderiales bacterium]
MRPIQVVYSLCVSAPLMLSGCAVVSVASTAVSLTGTAVSTGVAVGSTAVGAVTTVAKGAVNAGSAVVEIVTD